MMGPSDQVLNILSSCWAKSTQEEEGPGAPGLGGLRQFLPNTQA